jgi:hypothetical protein
VKVNNHQFLTYLIEEAMLGKLLSATIQSPELSPNNQIANETGVSLEEFNHCRDECAWNRSVAALAPDVHLIVAKLEEWPDGTATAEEHIAQQFKCAWHLLYLVLDLFWEEFLILQRAICVAISECAELAGQYHCVGGDIHVPAPEIDPHAVNMRT